MLIPFVLPKIFNWPDLRPIFLQFYQLLIAKWICIEIVGMMAVRIIPYFIEAF